MKIAFPYQGENVCLEQASYRQVSGSGTEMQVLSMLWLQASWFSVTVMNGILGIVC